MMQAKAVIGVKAVDYIKENITEEKKELTIFDRTIVKQVPVYNEKGEKLYTHMKVTTYEFNGKVFDDFLADNNGDHIEEYFESIGLGFHTNYNTGHSVAYGFIGISINNKSEEEVIKVFEKVRESLKNIGINEEPKLYTVMSN